MRAYTQGVQPIPLTFCLILCQRGVRAYTLPLSEVNVGTQTPRATTPAWYVACVHNPWDKAAFRRLLQSLMNEAHLSQQDVAVMARISRPQVSRWTSGAHRPGFDALQRFAEAMHSKHPGHDETVSRLVEAAGYESPAPRLVGHLTAEEAAVVLEYRKRRDQDSNGDKERRGA